MTTAVKGLDDEEDFASSALSPPAPPPYDYSSQGTDDEEDLASSALRSPL